MPWQINTSAFDTTVAGTISKASSMLPPLGIKYRLAEVPAASASTILPGCPIIQCQKMNPRLTHVTSKVKISPRMAPQSSD